MSIARFDFSKEVVSFREPLKYYAYKLTSNQEEANDLLQETMLKAFTYRSKFEDYTNLRAWLYTIMKNIFINNYRRSIKTRTMIDTTKELYFINLPQQDKDTMNPESRLRVKEMMEEIEKLSPDFKVPLKMYFEGYKYKEIAEHMQLPIGTVKSRIFLARKQLCRVL